MYLTGVHLAGVYLTGMLLTGVLLTGVHLTGMLLTAMHLTGVLLTGVPLYGVHLAVYAQVIERVSDSVLIAFMLISSCSCLRTHAFILSYLYAFSLRMVRIITRH